MTSLPPYHKRARVSKMIADQGINEVYAYLHQVDPTLAKRLQPNDSQRIGRAVEIFTNRAAVKHVAAAANLGIGK